MIRLTSFALSVLAALAGTAHAGPESVSAAGAAAFHALLESPAPSSAKLHASAEEDQLISLLDDPKPEVRAEAARSLKAYAPNSLNAENALLRVLDREREEESVSREAVKSLSWDTSHWTVKDRLLALAQDSQRTVSLRAITLKALYGIANLSDVESALQGVMEDSSAGSDLRAAAAWGLWGAAANNNFQAKPSLQTLAADSRQEPALRVEAVKSLYSALGDWNARDAVWALSKDAREDAAVRAAATLCLHAVNNQSEVRDYLDAMSNDERDEALRLAAVKALGGPSLELTRYFHVSYYMGRFIDPLEDQ